MALAWNTRGDGAGGGGSLVVYDGLVTVKDYGAKGDGVTNDAAAVQASINATGGACFPNGTYFLQAPYAGNPCGFTSKLGSATMTWTAAPGCRPVISGSGVVLIPSQGAGIPATANAGTFTAVAASVPAFIVRGLTFNGASASSNNTSSFSRFCLYLAGPVLPSGGIANLGLVDDCSFVLASTLYSQGNGCGLYVGDTTPLQTNVVHGSNVTVRDCTFTPSALVTSGSAGTAGATAGIRFEGMCNSVISGCTFYGLERAIELNGLTQICEGCRITDCLIYYCATGILLDYCGITFVKGCVADYTALPLDVNSSLFIEVSDCFFGSAPAHFTPVTFPTTNSVAGFTAYGTKGFNANTSNASYYWKVGSGAGVSGGVLTLTGNGSTYNAATSSYINADPQLNGGLAIPLIITGGSTNVLNSMVAVPALWTVSAYGVNKSTGAATVQATPVGFTPVTTSYTGAADWVQGVFCWEGACVFVHCDSLRVGNQYSDLRMRNTQLYQYGTLWPARATPTLVAASNTGSLGNTLIRSIDIENCTSIANNAIAPVTPSGMANNGYTHFLINAMCDGATYGFVRLANNNFSTASVACGNNPTTTYGAGNGAAWVSARVLYSPTTKSGTTITSLDGVWTAPTAVMSGNGVCAPLGVSAPTFA